MQQAGAGHGLEHGLGRKPGTTFEDLTAFFDRPSLRSVSRDARKSISDDLLDTFGRLIAMVRPDASFEVGAFEASFSRRMRAAYPAMRVVALEANPRVHERHAAKAIEAGVDYRHAAAADRDGTITLNIPERIGGRNMPEVSTMASLQRLSPDSDETAVEVPAIRLDSVARLGEDERCVLWIDVEGAMGTVLAGAPGTLERTALLFCEVEINSLWQGQALATDVVRLLGDHGLEPLTRDAERPGQFNALFGRSEMLDDEMRSLLMQYAARARRTMEGIAAEAGIETG